MHDDRWVHRGDLVESAIYSAQRDWRDSYAKGTALDDLLSEKIQYIETVVTIRPRGRLEVIVRMIATLPWEREVFLYKFERSCGEWRQTDGI